MANSYPPVMQISRILALAKARAQLIRLLRTDKLRERSEIGGLLFSPEPVYRSASMNSSIEVHRILVQVQVHVHCATVVEYEDAEVMVPIGDSSMRSDPAEHCPGSRG